MGMFTLDVLTEIAPEAYLEHTKTILELLINMLNKCNDPRSPLPAYVLTIMTNLVPLLEGNQEVITII